MDISLRPSGSIDPNQYIRFTSKQPYLSVDTTALHFSVKQDSNWIDIPFLFVADENNIRDYILYAEWEPKKQYRFTADSAAFKNILGHVSKPLEQDFRVRGMEEYGAIFINAKIAELGAKAASSVSSKTDYLITNEASGSSKYKKAVELHVPIITEEEFLNMIG